MVSIADQVVLGPRARVDGDLSYGDKKPVVPPGARVSNGQAVSMRSVKSRMAFASSAGASMAA